MCLLYALQSHLSHLINTDKAAGEVALRSALLLVQATRKKYVQRTSSLTSQNKM